MSDGTLQAAFEIKTACDEISRKLLAWHWAQTPRPHDFSALIKYVELRMLENPDYYARIGDPKTKTDWQQLDTTFCMRILLEPRQQSLSGPDLLGQLPHPGSGRRACNAVRTARNEAAHATDDQSETAAAIRFGEAIEALEEAYLGTSLTEKELSAYYRRAEALLGRCSGKATKPKKTGEKPSAAKKKPAPKRAAAPKAALPEKSSAGRESGNRTRPQTGGRRTNARQRRKSHWGRWLLLVTIVLLVMLLRAVDLGILSFPKTISAV